MSDNISNGITGSLKSTSKTIKYFNDILEEKVLRPNETLSESPTSFVNIFMDTIGNINGTNFFEMLMTKKEATRSTAILKRSLMRSLSAEDIVSVYGNPSTMTFVLGLPISQIKTQAVSKDGDNFLKKIRINKNTQFTLSGKPPFTLDYDIDIILTIDGTGNESIYAKFVIEGVYNMNLVDVTNSFINTTYQTVDDVDYIFLYLPARQYLRETEEFQISNIVGAYDFEIPYEDHLFGFEVLYRGPKLSTFRYITGVLDGVVISDGYNYSLTEKANGDKTISISFNRSPITFNPEGGSLLKIITYTTKGSEGNFNIPDWNIETPALAINLYQDRTDSYQDALLNLSLVSSINEGTASGGTDELTRDEIRALITENSQLKHISIAQIKNTAESIGLSFSNYRADVLAIYFRLSSLIKNGSTLIPTTMGQLYTKLSDLPISASSLTKLLTPIEIFKITASNFERIDNPSDFRTYIDTYEEHGETQLFFPYFMRISTGDIPEVRTYDMYKKESLTLKYEFYNESSLNSSSISTIDFLRDPMVESYVDGKYAGKYTIEFNMTTSSAIIDHINSAEEGDLDYIKVYITLISGSDKFVSRPCTIIQAEDTLIRFQVELDTDCGIDTYDRLNFNNYCIQPLPRDESTSDYFVGSEFDLRLSVGFLYNVVDGEGQPIARPSTSYDEVLTDLDKINNYYVSTVYKIEDVTFYEELTNRLDSVINLNMTQPVQAQYTEDVPFIYTADIYEVDGNGDIIYYSAEIPMPDGTTNTTQLPVIEFAAGETINDEFGDPTYEHLAGEFIFHDGLPVYDEESTTVAEIQDIPMVDRIFSHSHYDKVIEGFRTHIAKINSIASYFPDGCSTFMGVKNTIGQGNYFYLNRTTNRDVPVNDLSIRMSIGVMFDDIAGLDYTDINNDIIDKIVAYVTGFSGRELSFIKMLDTIKEQVPNIDYFELYSINDYESGICQSIFLDSNIEETNDTLSIRNKIDILNSNLDTNDLVFVPDIIIEILN